MKILIWGAGHSSRILAKTLKEDIEILAFVEDNTEIVGTSFFGYPIIAKEDITNYKFDKIVISILSTATAKTIRYWILENTNIKEAQIL